MLRQNLYIDLNADVGEGFDTDEALMPYISSANIACGYHAGDEGAMLATVELCLKHGVAIGAHPSFRDKLNFGRTEINLPEAEIMALITAQLQLMQDACNKAGATLHHVKPHGALYNMSARDANLAAAIAQAVYDFNPSLILFGLSGSHSVAAGVMAGLKTVAEVFADRTYQPDGSLTPRTLPNALIANEAQMIEQALMLVEEQKAISVDGNMIPMMAESICLHGDGPHAVSFARKINRAFIQRGIQIKAI